jgi:hypothetical protein
MKTVTERNSDVSAAATLELQSEGYAAISAEITRLLNLTAVGMQNPGDGDKYLRKIRSGLFGLIHLINAECLIVPGTPKPPGPRAV